MLVMIAACVCSYCNIIIMNKSVLIILSIIIIYCSHSTGNLIAKHREIFSRNPLFLGMRMPEARDLQPLERRYPRLSQAAMDIIKVYRLATDIAASVDEEYISLILSLSQYICTVVSSVGSK